MVAALDYKTETFGCC